MRRLPLAMIVVLAAVAMCFAVLSYLRIEQDVAGSIFEHQIALSIAALFLGTIGLVHQSLEGRRARGNWTALPNIPVLFDDYTLPWALMVVYGAFIAYAVSGLGTIAVWLVGEGTGIFVSSLVPGLRIILSCLVFYYVSSWIGSRCDRRPWFATAAVVLVDQAGTILTSLVIRPATSTAVPGAVLLTLLYLFVAFFGTWRSRRMRLLRYLHYLLNFLPVGTQYAVANQMFEEVQRAMPDGAGSKVTLVRPELAGADHLPNSKMT